MPLDWIVAVALLLVCCPAPSMQTACPRIVYNDTSRPYNMALVIGELTTLENLAPFWKPQYAEMETIAAPSGGTVLLASRFVAVEQLAKSITDHGTRHIVTSSGSVQPMTDLLNYLRERGMPFPFITVMDDPGPAAEIFQSNVQIVAFKDDDVGFLAGAKAGVMSRRARVAGYFGHALSPLKRFRNGFANGVATTCPHCIVDGVYHRFVRLEDGSRHIAEFIRRGADVIFAAAGSAGNDAMFQTALKTSQNGTAWPVYVIGVDTDIYFDASFQSESDARPYLLGSAVKDVALGVRCSANDAISGSFSPGLRLYTAANEGVRFTECHESCQFSSRKDDKEMEFWLNQMQNERVSTGVDADGLILAHVNVTDHGATMQPMFGDTSRPATGRILFCGERVHFLQEPLNTPSGPQGIFFDATSNSLDEVFYDGAPLPSIYAAGTTTVCALPARGSGTRHSWLVTTGGDHHTAATGLDRGCGGRDLCGFNLTHVTVGDGVVPTSTALPTPTPLTAGILKNHVAAVVHDENIVNTRTGSRMIVAGGNRDGRALIDVHECTLGPFDADTYTPFRCSWRELAPLPHVLPPHAVMAHLQQKLEGFSGRDWLVIASNATREFLLYNVDADVWVVKTSSNDPPSGMRPDCTFPLGKRFGTLVHEPVLDAAGLQTGLNHVIYTLNIARSMWVSSRQASPTSALVHDMKCTVQVAQTLALDTPKRPKLDLHRVYFYNAAVGAASMSLVTFPSITCDERLREGLGLEGVSCARCPTGLYAMDGECHPCTTASNRSVAFGCPLEEEQGVRLYIVVPVVVCVFVLGLAVGAVVWFRAALPHSSRNVVNAPRNGTMCVLSATMADAITLWQRNPARMAEATELFHGLVSRTTAQHDGYEVSTSGDVVTIVTATPLQAVRIAADLLRGYCEIEWPRRLPVGLAIGMDAGRPVVVPTQDAFDYSGPTVDNAQTICKEAQMHQILVTQDMHDVASDVLELSGVNVRSSFDIRFSADSVIHVLELAVPDIAMALRSSRSEADFSTASGQEDVLGAPKSLTDEEEDEMNAMVVDGVVSTVEFQLIHKLTGYIILNSLRVLTVHDREDALRVLIDRLRVYPTLGDQVQDGQNKMLRDLTSRVMQTLDIVELRIVMEMFESSMELTHEGVGVPRSPALNPLGADANASKSPPTKAVATAESQ